MTILLRQSTAKAISFGPFVDATDGVTPETGLVSALDHASTGIKLSKNGGALTIRHATVTATTYDGYGNYIVTLDTTDTNTLGTMRMQFIETATCLPVWMDFMVLPATVYDALVTNATTAAGGLGDIQRVAGTVQTAGDLVTVIAALQADLPQRITKNVALANFVFFMEDSSNVGTGKTGLTITATRSLDGAAFAACANAATEISGGFYKISFDATDLNANIVALSFAGTGAVTRRLTIVTQPT